MSDHVYWILALEIRPGQYENMESLMAEMVATTEADEPGALNYEWSVSEDKKTCHLFERYQDSEAALTHSRNFGSKFAKRFMEVFRPISFTLYGNPSQAVIKNFSAMQPVLIESIGGFSR